MPVVATSGRRLTQRLWWHYSWERYGAYIVSSSTDRCQSSPEPHWISRLSYSCGLLVGRAEEQPGGGTVKCDDVGLRVPTCIVDICVLIGICRWRFVMLLPPSR